MPAGSEQFTWLRWWPWKRSCSFCGRELKVKDVGEIRTNIGPDGAVSERFLWCVDHRGGRSG